MTAALYGSRGPVSAPFSNKDNKPELFDWQSTPTTATKDELNAITSNKTEKVPSVGNPLPGVSNIEDWNGPNDEANPLNWSLKWKIYTASMVGVQCFTITFGSSTITPATKAIAEHFSTSIYAAILPLTLYVIGLGAGPVVSAPISETFGRRAVYLGLFPPSLLFTLGAGFAKNFSTLLLCRFLAGALGSGCLAVGAGSNGDIWDHKARAIAIGAFVFTPFLGTAFGPIIGGYVTLEKDWRWTQWTIIFVGVFSLVFSLPQRETYKKIILQKRAKKLGLKPPPASYTSNADRFKAILIITLFRPLNMLVTESIVAFLSIYTAFNFAILFAFFAAFPLIFESPYPEIQIYHFNIGESGLVFLAICLGICIATSIYIVLDRVYYHAKLAKRIALGDNTNLPHEERLPAAMLGSVLLPIGLFWVAWSAREDIHWMVPIFGTIPFAIGNTLVFTSAMSYLVDTYGGEYSASAAAANGMLRYAAGAGFPLFTIQMYRAMGVRWATSLLGFVSVGLMPIPWVFYRYGAKIRQRSSYT